MSHKNLCKMLYRLSCLHDHNIAETHSVRESPQFRIIHKDRWIYASIMARALRSLHRVIHTQPAAVNWPSYLYLCTLPHYTRGSSQQATTPESTLLILGLTDPYMQRK